jgi:[ribosomal protein S5]-alanine N-acetyltransferase
VQTQITSQRLKLDSLTDEDFHFIRELVNSKGWLQFIGDRKVYSDADAVAYIKKINSTADLTYWVVRLRQSSVPIGVVTFMKRPHLEHFDIGFAFLPDYSGQGYAFEAVNEVLSIVRKNPQHDVIFATTLPNNTRSVKLLTKLGLLFEKKIVVGEETLHVYSVRRLQKL